MDRDDTVLRPFKLIPRMSVIFIFVMLLICYRCRASLRRVWTQEFERRASRDSKDPRGNDRLRHGVVEGLDTA